MRLKRLAGSLPALFLCSSGAAAFLPSRPLGVSHIHDIPSHLPQIKRLPAAPLNLKKGGTKKKKVKSNMITVNKLAYRNYEVLETWEAGISLVGTEVKR
mmetsp:Transcript_32528/g.58776  ORF Transcript_32528/g.58776 Transcript_32528/m.58776 type:complete len:99 (+) Transcript_32528:172-468(+)